MKFEVENCLGSDVQSSEVQSSEVLGFKTLVAIENVHINLITLFIIQ